MPKQGDSAKPLAAADVRKAPAAKDIPPMRLLPTIGAIALFGAHFYWLLLEYWRVTAPGAAPAPYHGLPMWPTFAAVAGYLVMVKLGPMLMQNTGAITREVFEVKVVYNIYQSLLNGWIVVGLWSAVLERGWPWWGQRFGDLEGLGMVNVDATWNKMAFFVYIHFLDKLLEYVDTVFIILGKKDEQLSFLHVTHHAMMAPVWLLVVHYACGGEAWWGSMMNSLVHVVMYGYYALTALGVQIPWKRAVTDMQMVQFVLVSVQSAYEAYLTYYVQKPVYPFWLGALQFFVMMTMLAMFSVFYTKKYKKDVAAKGEPKKVE
jgi:hypothetical protein